MSEDIPEPVENRPWRQEDGPPPRVWCWPSSHRPALDVWSHGRWRYATVEARQDWADGRTVYHVSVDLDGSHKTVPRFHPWPQPGLRVAHAPTAEPFEPRVRPRS